ncbi:hypothetical protein P152DRAFT_457934 [Eremomyces bilateralis CBS 781.70]|uniref:Uncharacterized protein n=1 Tax=Eremomyces bilateralis CBS 781.70 TaxID=1392243 RepID=A0A6G1G498_9PEZI|nr:uncharacterized protein P152DRAFT_457934 [Eremomyces bilateralis CBS 781.70]KAF1812740.1 hypothetical protein P152DRAFT_457934 [Eremomyces bilateralis CBS 781.70]
MADDEYEPSNVAPMQTGKVIPPQRSVTAYPPIDLDPHFTRVVKYARPSDWAEFAILPWTGVGFFHWWHGRYGSDTKMAYKACQRVNFSVGLMTAFCVLYVRSSYRFMGFRENARETEMDMREMTDRVKKGLPLYGESRLSEYMQGVAARNSRNSQVLLHVLPMFNIVNHNMHGVDTAKYYRNAERELEAEGKKAAGS